MAGIMLTTIGNFRSIDTASSPSEDLYSFSTFTFTNANIGGRTGPNLSTLLSSYDTITNPWLSNSSNYTAANGIQTWTVPTTGTYTIIARGAQGAPASATAGGVGAIMQGDFALTQGQKINIVVGQTARVPPARPGRNGSGGGGTFVVKSNVSTPSTADILVIAGGGGGCGTAFLPNANASITTSGRNSTGGFYIGQGGTNGNGGGQSFGATSNGAGAGFLSNGAANGLGGGIAYIFGANGGAINSTYAPEGGGFGGGGAPNNGDLNRMGGGGGYSGGGASDASGNTATSTLAGGGGGSFNSGSNQINATNSSGNFGNGSVTITFIG